MADFQKGAGGAASAASAIKRLQRELKEINKSPSKFWTAEPVNDDIFEWHYTIKGPKGSDFEKGIYHGRIVFPLNYPFAPPHIMLLTPNGRFEVNKKICLSISSFHPELWQPAWGIRTMIEALRSFFPSPPEGAVGALNYPPEVRKKIAETESRQWKCAICDMTNAELLPNCDDEEEVVDDMNDGKVKEGQEIVGLREEDKEKSSGKTNNIDPVCIPVLPELDSDATPRDSEEVKNQSSSNGTSASGTNFNLVSSNNTDSTNGNQNSQTLINGKSNSIHSNGRLSNANGNENLQNQESSETEEVLDRGNKNTTQGSQSVGSVGSVRSVNTIMSDSVSMTDALGKGDTCGEIERFADGRETKSKTGEKNENQVSKSPSDKSKSKKESSSSASKTGSGSLSNQDPLVKMGHSFKTKYEKEKPKLQTAEQVLKILKESDKNLVITKAYNDSIKRIKEADERKKKTAVNLESESGTNTTSSTAAGTVTTGTSESGSKVTESSSAGPDSTSTDATVPTPGYSARADSLLNSSSAATRQAHILVVLREEIKKLKPSSEFKSGRTSSKRWAMAVDVVLAMLGIFIPYQFYTMMGDYPGSVALNNI